MLSLLSLSLKRITTTRRIKVPFSVCLVAIIVSANTKSRYFNSNFSILEL